MTNESLSTVIEKLSQGDQAAAEVAQSIWSDLLQGFRDSAWSFEDSERLKAFLITATRHRFLDRARQHRRRLRQEASESTRDRLENAVSSTQPRPSEVLQAAELWDRILAECAPAHRDILQLKRDGFTATEIASRTGLHADSIRRILRDLACRIGVGK